MLFIVILLNLISSYLISSVFKNFLIIFVSFFSFVVLNMEILSLFHSINSFNVIFFSILNLVFSIFLFKYKKAEFLKINFDFKRLKNSLFLDKSLLVLSISFLILISTMLFLALVVPVLEPDSQTYHFIRAYDFVKFHSLNHFEINDARALVMPINSEIMYSWLYLFKKNLYGYGIVSYCSFICFIASFWQIAEKFKFPFRKRLFAVFIFSSFASVIVQMASLQTDLLVGSFGALFIAIYLKDNSKSSIYFSSLALALSMGIKSTGVIMALGCYFLIILYEKFINKKPEKIKHLTIFLFLNFLIFSSYNYVQNFLQFGNFLANRSSLLGHGFWGGFKGYIANIINLSFQFLDFTGFKWGFYLNDSIFHLKEVIFNFLNIDKFLGTNVEQEIVNIFTDEQTVGFGILGFLAFLPMIFLSLLKPIFNKNKKTIFISFLALTFILNFLLLARTMAYMVYSIRFIIAFVCLSACVLVYCYSKKGLYKKIIIAFCLFYMTLLPFSIKRMPFFKVFNNYKLNNYNLKALEKDAFEGKIIKTQNTFVIYKTILERYKDKKNIAIIKTTETSMLYLTTLENKDRKIDFLNASNLTKERLNNYDLVILDSEKQDDNVFNPSDILIDYKIEDKNITFKDNKNLNCYFDYLDDSNKIVKNKKEDADKRICLTYFYILENIKNFKLDYQEKFYKDTNNSFSNIYYFLKLN